MPKEIILPKLGMDMTEGTIISWFVEEGKYVNKGEPLLEVLTDKVSIEVEAEESGVLLKKIGEENQEYPVFTVIGYLGEEGEALPEKENDHSIESEEIKPKEKGKESKPPLFERMPTSVKETSNRESVEVTEQDSLESIRLKREVSIEKVRATPAARRLAKEHHIILENLVGSGPNGRIQIEDIENMIIKHGEKLKEEEVLVKETQEKEEVMINTDLEVISGNSENISLTSSEITPKKDLIQKVSSLAKIKKFVDDLDLAPRMDTRGPDGRVIPGEPVSTKRFRYKEDDFDTDYGEYVKVLPKTSEEKLDSMINKMVPEGKEGLEGSVDNLEIPEFEKGSKAEDKTRDFDSFTEELPVIEEEKKYLTEDSFEPYESEKKERGIKLSGKRKIIAERMVKSNLENAVITLTVEIDMTEVKELRKKITKKIEQESHYRCTFTDFLLMSVGRALVKHPIINSSLIDDEIIEHPYVNLGLAVGLDDGLIVPVIRNTQEMTFVDMVKNRGETLKAVKNKYIVQEDLKGSTFTITNLGMYGVLEFTAIINQPNSGILSVGEVVHRMRMHQGEAKMRSVMKVSLNLDHRIADGVEGAKFLQDLKTDMENPSVLLF